MFSEMYFGNSLEEWLISLLIIVCALILNKGIILINKHVIRKITSRTKNRLDDILFRMLQAPVLLGIILLAVWIALSRLEFDVKFDVLLKRSYQFLIVLNVTWFLVRFVNALIEEYLVPVAEDPDRKYIDNTLLSIVRRTVLGVIWSIGIVMALRNVGVDVGALIAGLGIGGLAFALAAQDTIKNIFGGITIFTDRPFRIGDRVKVDGFDGFVEDIGIRSTRLRTLEKRLVTIPNYKIVDASIENISDEPMRRVVMVIGLTYGTTPEAMNEAISILKNIPKRINEVDEESLIAVFSDFAAYSLNLKLIYWIKSTGDVTEVPSKVNFEILTAFNKAGLDFAFPTQTILVEEAEGKL